jgi:hypothetical protein
MNWRRQVLLEKKSIFFKTAYLSQPLRKAEISMCSCRLSPDVESAKKVKLLNN